jgi:hypothetical protein
MLSSMAVGFNEDYSLSHNDFKVTLTLDASPIAPAKAFLVRDATKQSNLIHTWKIALYI